MNTATFISKTKTGVLNTVWVAVFAMVTAPLFMYAVGIRSILGLIASVLGAGLLAFALYAVRGLVGGIRELTISDTGAQLVRKKATIELTWDEISQAKFETVNTTPWLTFVTNEKKKHRICLENYKEDEQTQITELVMNHIPEKTTSTEDWIIGNRIPTSIIKKGIEVIRK